ncbi:MAG: tyrosine-type recombinase/integrase [Selenomonas sp.]|nr:tyrosine-type recombinase/integrase [Selenomonas sp.]
MTTSKTKGKARLDQEGSIYFSNARGCWVATISIGYNPKTGKRIRRLKTAASQREARKKLEELKLKYASVTSVDAEHITTGEWVQKWFQTYVEPKIRENTQMGYLSIIGIITEELGNIRLDRLTAIDIQSVIFGRLKKQYRSAQLFRLLIKKAMEKAVRLHMLSENPADDLELPPKPAKREFVKPSENDWQTLLDAKTPYYGWHWLIMTEYVTGARISELCALKWEDLLILTEDANGKEEWKPLAGSKLHAVSGRQHTKGGALHIGHSMVSGRNEKKGAPRKLLRCPTKTREGDRHLPVPPDYCAEMLDYRHRQLEYQFSMGGAYQDEGYIFTKWDGTPISPRAFCSYYSKLRQRLGIGTTLHMLRHDMASRMKASHQFDLKDVQSQLGHSTIQITMDLYTHIDDAQKEAVKGWLQNGLSTLLQAGGQSLKNHRDKSSNF